MPDSDSIRFAYFGSPAFSAAFLDELEKAGLVPELVVTAPDKKRGRGQHIKPTAVKSWAQKRDIDVLTPTKLNEEFINKLSDQGPWDMFAVVAYGHIIPPAILDMPEHGVVNVHPSLLPKLRGAAPLHGAILHEDESGVTIMQMDEKLDHGPILAQEKLEFNEWPPYYNELETRVIESGGPLLAQSMRAFKVGEVEPTPQNHEVATYQGKISKNEAEIDLDDDPETNLRKIRAYQQWPKAHFFDDNDTRVLITRAHLEDGELVIDTVKPAGESEMSYTDFKSSTKN